MIEENNVISIRKTDRFTLCTGKLHKDGSIEEIHKIGNAYLKPGAKTFRLKFWMHPRESYFLSRDHDSDLIYTILSVEEYLGPNLEPKTTWREIGKGYVMGNYIRLEFYTMKDEVYLSLFPEKFESKEESIAS
ncbi:MAG: hypothetical protein JNL11_14970 [Bdellovibrionaceae bacterium]|nr:hypothetical protein [Pseudobdellovibrionaceae bacterium]